MLSTTHIKISKISVKAFWTFALICFGLSAHIVGQAKFSVKRINNQFALVVQGQPKNNVALEEQLKVFTKSAYQSGNLPPIAGAYDEEGSVITFRPTFPFRTGKTYIAILASQKPFEFTIPQPTTTKLVKVNHVFPSADTLPNNILKFYVVFNQPMSEGQALKHVFLLDDTGKPLENIFLELDPELWNDDQTRLTLWVNPGRVKRALGPNEHLGPAIEISKVYSLLIKKGWKDIHGIPIKEDFHKVITTISPDRASPVPSTWTITKPKIGSLSPLMLHFHESLDFALLQHAFQLYTAPGTEVVCTIQLGKKEQSISFIPKKPWTKGQYEIKVDSKLEDLAANNLNRLFDTDLKKLPPSSSNQDFHFLTFQLQEN